MELSSRRFFLDSLLRNEQAAIRLSEVIDGNGQDILLAACGHDLEGIIAKRKDSAYRSGRLGDWVKIKSIQSDSFTVVGYEQSSVARGGIGIYFSLPETVATGYTLGLLGPAFA
ncbi:hypothetical protein [Rhizobium sp. RHZ02]|uniref:ATP-dependent DNA ligase n=1 Tax=Rhizobium sp. RHZ02 TaxID=2769306 RepID=UPI00391DBD92|nr:bifunctional non-homologous end joining protein LigD [Rhizobium sp. 57MFTsu3.2]